MEPNSDTRARARQAYERARLWLGLRAALPVLPMVALSLIVCDTPALSFGAGALLFAVAVAFRVRGGALARALAPGLLAGSAPLILPVVLRASGHCCIGGTCWSVCMLGCSLGGLLAGMAVGIVAASEPKGRTTFLISATVIAGLSGTLGCAIVGASGIAGMAVAIAATSLPAAVLART